MAVRVESWADGDPAELRKARGAFFTPRPVAQYLTTWAVRSVADRILEPSCGEAAFLLAAALRLDGLRSDTFTSEPSGALDGVEIHPSSAAAAQRLLEGAGARATVRTADFLSVPPTGDYDAVVGNPPFVRYQDFAGAARATARAAALQAGVRLSGLASSWAAFAVHAALFLRPGGRLGLVLPAELLSVNYAAQVRRFLLQRFRSVELVVFEQRVFPGVLEEVVLLMADGYAEGPTDHAHVLQVRDASELTGPAASAPAHPWRPRRPEDKWTPSLLPSSALESFGSALDGDGFAELEMWGDTTLGMVTGNNAYFTMSPARAAELSLEYSDVLTISPPGSRHLRGLSLTAEALRRLGAAGHATLLFRPSGEPSAAAQRYIDAGQTAAADQAYKCRVRRPWWRVPLVPPADLLLTYMNADTPRLTTNAARVRHLNSVHGVFLRPPWKQLGRRLLPLGSLTTVTLVGAETVGRSYGGGMLKLEPREADRLPVVSPELLKASAGALTAIRPEVAAALKAGRLLEAVGLVDHVLLRGELGMTASDLTALRAAHGELSARRAARGAGTRGAAGRRS